MKKPLVVITGPTAVGKTDISVLVAGQLGGEIVSADSMQIYKGMNIGTAKPTPSEMGGIRHHMIDVVEAWQDYSVAEYQRQARDCIEDIHRRGKLPIVVGGTGLYINAISYDLDFADTVSDQKLRTHLARMVQERGKEYLYEELKRVDPDTANRLHVNDTKRIIRALEVYYCSGRPMSAHYTGPRRQASYNLIIIGLKMDREKLYERIEKRVDKMMEDGLVAEVKGLLAKGCTREMISMQGLGYKEIIGYLEGEYTLKEAVGLLKRNTRRFAKRQFTWFRRDDRIFWIDVYQLGDKVKIANEITEYIRFRLNV
jgi:tRNA dimethylallyltransferase